MGSKTKFFLIFKTVAGHPGWKYSSKDLNGPELPRHLLSLLQYNVELLCSSLLSTTKSPRCLHENHYKSYQHPPYALCIHPTMACSQNMTCLLLRAQSVQTPLGPIVLLVRREIPPAGCTVPHKQREATLSAQRITHRVSCDGAGVLLRHPPLHTECCAVH